MRIIKNIGLSMMFGLSIFIIMGLPFMDEKIRMDIISVLVMSGIIGAISKIYDTNIALLPATLLHIGGGVTAFLIVAYVRAWFPFKLTIILTSISIFVAIFMIIWTIFYLIEKKNLEFTNKISNKH